MHGPHGGYGVIIVEVRQSLVCKFGNHFELSFGGSNRSCDPYCDKVLQRYIGTCDNNGLIPRNFPLQARRDTSALDQ